MSLSSFHHVFAPGSGERALLLLHGTGGDENSLLRFSSLLHQQAPVLSVRGNIMEDGRYPRFFRRFRENVFDEGSIIEQCGLLADFLKDAAIKYSLDEGAIDAFGFSNGANMAAATMLLQPGSISRAVMVRAMVPIRPTEPPRLTGSSALILAGAHDQISPSQHASELALLLAQYGAAIEFEELPTGHELTSQDLIRAADFLAKAEK